MARIGSMFVNLALQDASFINGLKRASAETSKTMVSIRRSVNIATVAFAALGGSAVVGAIGRMADSWSDMSSRVGLAVGDMQQAPAMMREIVGVADRTYSSLSQTAEAFIANRQALRDLGYSVQDTLKFTEALNSAMVVSGAKGQQAESVQRALAKAMAVGRMDAQGLETVLASGGRVAQALAEELDTTVSGLRNMSSQGKITSAVITSALIGSFKQLQAEAEEMPATIEDGFLKIRNAIQAIVGEADKASGVSQTIGTALSEIGRSLANNIPQILRGFQLATSAMITMATYAAGRFAISLGVAAVGAMLKAGAAARALSLALRAIPMMALVAAGTYVVDKFIDLTRATGGVGAAFSEVWKVAKAWFEGMRLGLSAMGDRVKAIGLEIKGIFSDDAAARAGELWASAAAKQRTALDGVKVAATDLWARVKEGAAAAVAGFSDATGGAGNLRDAVDSISDEALKKLQEAAKKLAEDFRALAERLVPDIGAAREYREMLDLLDQAERAGLKTAVSFEQLRQAARGNFMDTLGLETIAPKFDDATEALKRFQQQAGMDLESIQQDTAARMAAITAPFEKAVEFADQLSKNLAQSIVYGQSIGQALVNSFKAAAAEAMANGLFKLLLGDKSGGGGLFGGIFKGIGSIFGGARANGGPVSPGKAYMVGERGPELIVPRAAGHVIANDNLRGGGDTIVNVDARGAVSPEAVREMVFEGVAHAMQYTDRSFTSAGRMRLGWSMGA